MASSVVYDWGEIHEDTSPRWSVLLSEDIANQLENFWGKLVRIEPIKELSEMMYGEICVSKHRLHRTTPPELDMELEE
jgi:hypothetical protein